MTPDLQKSAFPAGDSNSLRPKKKHQPATQLPPLRDQIVSSVRLWAGQLDDDQLTGPSALDLCCTLFRRFLHSQLPEASRWDTPEDAPWERLMTKLCGARKLELSACLWLALKLVVSTPEAPRA